MLALFAILDHLQHARRKCDEYIVEAEVLKRYDTRDLAAPEYRELSALIKLAELQAESILREYLVAKEKSMKGAS
jgi:hypothetical protein